MNWRSPQQLRQERSRTTVIEIEWPKETETVINLSLSKANWRHCDNFTQLRRALHIHGTFASANYQITTMHANWDWHFVSCNSIFTHCRSLASWFNWRTICLINRWWCLTGGDSERDRDQEFSLVDNIECNLRVNVSAIPSTLWHHHVFVNIVKVGGRGEPLMQMTILLLLIMSERRITRIGIF